MSAGVRRLGAVFVVLALVTAGSQTLLAPLAYAGNTQAGDNEADSDQDGDANSGDAVTGQVVGAVSSGDTSIDATNRSENVDAETGDAEGANDANGFVGLNASARSEAEAVTVNQECTGCITVAGATAPAIAANTQDGDNDASFDQTADASSGDGVGGQVIGAVNAGGSTAITAANTSTDVDVETGDADAANDASGFVGLNAAASSEAVAVAVNDGCGGCIAVAGASATGTAANTQDGDNDASFDQTADASSGDGVGGQVIGAVNSGGSTSIDATNRSADVDVETGDAEGANDASGFVGLNASASSGAVAVAVNDECQGCIAVASATAPAIAANTQDGDNDASFDQTADASSGDGVGGQVIGAVNSGGTTSIVQSNASTDIDIDTGDGGFSNAGVTFVGLSLTTGSLVI